VGRIYPSGLILAFFLSGASGLIYEILWQRQMMLAFGASAPAVTAILTAIFLGIALGSRAISLLNRLTDNPLVLYAGIEVSIGIWGYSVPWLMRAADVLYVQANQVVGPEHALIDPLRFVLAIAVVLPATLCMGATIPVMVRLAGEVSPHDRSTGADWAYGLNILGAVSGCLLAGFVLIRTLGLYRSREVAAALNLLVMLLAILLMRPRGRHFAARLPGGKSPPVQPLSGAPPLPADLPRFAILYFLAGFVALALEVVWLRFLGIINTNSNTTFTIALAVYLTGMGFGSLLVYPLLRRRLPPRAIFALANLGTAVTSLLCFPVIYRAPDLTRAWILQRAAAGTLGLGHIIMTEATLGLGLMLLPTICMGLVYPAVCDIIPARAVRRKELVGSLYFRGTLGSVAGILLAGGWLVPALGLHGAFACVVLLALLLFVGAGLAGRSFPISRKLSFGLAALLCILIIQVPVRAVPVLRTNKVQQIAGEWRVLSEDGRTPASVRLLRFAAGRTATVMVRESWDPRHPQAAELRNRYIYVDDQMVASTDVEAKVDAVMLAHLPLLLHPAPRRALTVGFGSGGTSHSMTTHPDLQVDCVEIEPEVVGSAHLLVEQNFGVLSHPRFRLILNDARDHLHAGTDSYDVISTDVTNLQYMQNGSLYSVEYFQLMKQKLRPGGIACAWIPLASISNLELRILMASFQRVFPHASLWHMNHTWTTFGILIGTPTALSIDYSRLAAGFADEGIGRDLAQIRMQDPLQLIHCLLLDETGMRTFVGDAPLHTDDLPRLEFTSPVSFYQRDQTFLTNLLSTTRLRPESHLPYVVNLPSGAEEQFQNHETASRAFYDFMISSYREMLVKDDGPRGFRQRLIHLREAMEHAARGLAALPEDRTREFVYGRSYARLRAVENLLSGKARPAASAAQERR
jgi:spermidine synthase